MPDPMITTSHSVIVVCVLVLLASVLVRVVVGEEEGEVEAEIWKEARLELKQERRRWRKAMCDWKGFFGKGEAFAGRRPLLDCMLLDVFI